MKSQDKNKFAGAIVRFEASFIDQIIIILIFVLGVFVYKLFTGVPLPQINLQALAQEMLVSKSLPLNLSFLLVSLFYSIFLLYKYSTTLGGRIMNTKLVDTNFQKPTLKQIMIRETIGRLGAGAFFGIGYFSVIYNEKKQGWHDERAQTYVIHTKPVKKELINFPVRAGTIPNIVLILGLIEGAAFFLILLLLVYALRLDSIGHSSPESFQISLPFFLLFMLPALAQVLCSLVLRRQNDLEKLSGNYHSWGSIFFILLQFNSFFLLLTLIIFRNQLGIYF